MTLTEIIDPLSLETASLSSEVAPRRPGSSWRKYSPQRRVSTHARTPELVVAQRAVLRKSVQTSAESRRMIFPGARNIRRRSYPRPPEWPGVGVVPVGAGRSRQTRPGAGGPRRVRSGSNRPVLEVLLWVVGQFDGQGVLLHVCCKAFQHRLFGMTWSEVGARRARRAVGGAWRDSATMCYSGPGAGRSGGVLPGPVALRALEVASYRRSRGQGVREHHAPVGALRRYA